MQVILGFLGYVKIPLNLVQLSISLENILKLLLRRAVDKDQEKNDEMQELINRALEGQRALTDFLRIGRKFN
jgi:hypothetical protein